MISVALGNAAVAVDELVVAEMVQSPLAIVARTLPQRALIVRFFTVREVALNAPRGKRRRLRKGGGKKGGDDVVMCKDVERQRAEGGKEERGGV